MVARNYRYPLGLEQTGEKAIIVQTDVGIYSPETEPLEQMGLSQKAEIVKDPGQIGEAAHCQKNRHEKAKQRKGPQQLGARHGQSRKNIAVRQWITSHI